jgi:hypothetical protein
MVSFFTRLNEFFLRFTGRIDGDGSGAVDFFEMLIEPGMPVLAEKLSRFGWLYILALVAAVTVLVLVMLNIRRVEAGVAAAVLIAVGTGYLAGHGVMVIALILSVPLALIIRRAKTV